MVAVPRDEIGSWREDRAAVVATGAAVVAVFSVLTDLTLCCTPFGAGDGSDGDAATPDVADGTSGDSAPSSAICPDAEGYPTVAAVFRAPSEPRIASDGPWNTSN